MTKALPSSLEIAQAATLRPIEEIAALAGLESDEVEPYGRTKAKIDLAVLDRLKDTPDGKLVCVTAITPTKAGEGKTTTLTNTAIMFARMGSRVLVLDADLRQPSCLRALGVESDCGLRCDRLSGVGHVNGHLAAGLDLHLSHGAGERARRDRDEI